ncbi:MAG: hypothetical protein JWN14_28 [Chthonomonadales bacterium]|nr:hypothetical protein [Chthonomonadales bacterium]
MKFSSMNTDALSAIILIAEDLGLSPSRTTLEHAFYLCERHGSSLPQFATLPRSKMGRCRIEQDGAIYVDPCQCGSHLGAVVIHELAHRLCYCSPRFEDLNSPHMAEYDRREFQELVAYGVEWLFRNLQIDNETFQDA